MKKKEKRMILILLLIAIVIIATILVLKNRKKEKEDEIQNSQVLEEREQEEFVQVLNDGTRINTSSKLNQTKEFDGLEISNFQLTSKDNVSLLLGTIKNNTDETKGDYPVSIKIIDENGNEIVTVGGYIGEVKPGGTTQLNCSASFDYVNAYDFEITRK